MPSQSLMRKPSKPSSSLSRSVFSAPCSCIRTGSAPAIETAEYDGMIEPTPASIAGTYGSTCSRLQLVQAVDVGDALVDRVARARERRVVRGAAVADPVLGGGEHLVRAGQVARVVALQARRSRRRHRRHQRRVLAERLVAAAPALVARDAQARRERPRHAGRADLLRGGPLDLLDQVGVARGAQARVVREDRRADHVVVAVHGVDAVDQRDLQPRGQRLRAGSRRPCPPSRRPCSASAPSRRRTAPSRGRGRRSARATAGPGARPGSSGRPSRPASSGPAGPRRARRCVCAGSR